MTTITIDPRRVTGRLDRRVFGGFIEHLGRCIYGGVYEPASAVSDSRGFRQDVLGLLKELRVSVLRWPGGNFVSNYHWQDGIGPGPSRPARPDMAWGGIESNLFGTDEYVDYCRELGAEPYLCLNMGSGTLAEALAWVEYCNEERPTYWADKRRENGHENPHAVHWWGLGNELYGAWQTGSLSAGEYVAKAERWGRAIKMLDPSVALVSCGETGWSDWDAEVVRGLVSLIDLHSIHIYTGADDYWTNALSPHVCERAIDIAAAQLRRSAYLQKLGHVPRIAVDEWNVWFRVMDSSLEERFAAQDVVAVGTFLNIFVRKCEWVKMANLAQLVNAIAPIVTAGDSAVVQPIYYPVLFHAQGHLSVAVDCRVDGPEVEAPADMATRWEHRLDDLGPFTLLDAAVTVDEKLSAVAATIVNRSEHEERVELRLRDARFAGTVRLRTVSGQGRPSAVPGVADVDVSDGTEAPGCGPLVLRLPAKSVTLIESGLARLTDSRLPHRSMRQSASTNAQDQSVKRKQRISADGTYRARSRGEGLRRRRQGARRPEP